MDEERFCNDEYEEQYYGFSSTSLFEDFKEEVQNSIKMALKELEVALKEKQYNQILHDKNIIDMYSIFMERAKIPLQKFKEEAVKIFAIPKNVILEEDIYNTDQYSDEDIKKLRKEVADLEKELLREQVFLAKCKQQREIVNTVIKPVQEKVNDMIKFLKNLPQDVDEKNYKKTLNICEELIQYYFKTDETETDQSEMITINYVRNVDNFF